jgi:hypothetical protein
LTEAAAGTGREDSPEVSRRGPGDPLGRIVFAVLVLACFGAFFLTQRLKHTPTVVQTPKLAPYFSPYPGGHVPLEAISFKLASADHVTVTVIDSDGNGVATLVRELPVPRYKTLSLRWDGRRGVAHAYTVTVSDSGRTKHLIPHIHGPLAKPGEYRVRVSFRHHDALNLPRSFRLVGP